MAWTYLGVIYLQLGRTHLANRAFKEAQAQEPGYLRGWAGQALVAEVRDSPTVHQHGSQGGIGARLPQGLGRIRIRTDPHLKRPPGFAWTDADPDPGGKKA